MRAVTFAEPGRVEVRQIPDPLPPGPDDALVRMTVAGLCGSDLHIFKGHTPIEEGAGLGHELVGVVERVGDGVRRVAVGDRVVASFVIACGGCRLCRRGWFSQCEERAILGHGALFGGLGGAQADLCLIPNADLNLFRLPETVTDAQAVFVGDQLATGYFCAVRGEVSPGDTVLVVGAGAVGAMAILSAQVLGAARVLAVDPDPRRLELAARLGAEPLDPNHVNVEMAVRELTGDLGVDVALECVGRKEAVEGAIQALRAAGTLSMVGVPDQVTGDFPYYDAWNRDLTVRSGICNVHAYAAPLLALIAGGRLHPEQVVSAQMPLTEAPRAYLAFANHEATKVLLTP